MFLIYIMVSKLSSSCILELNVTINPLLMSVCDVHCSWWTIHPSHTSRDLHVVLVAFNQTGNVHGPDPTTDHHIHRDVCDLVISEVIAAQLEDGDFEMLHSMSHTGGDGPSYYIATGCLGHRNHSWGCEGCMARGHKHACSA